MIVENTPVGHFYFQSNKKIHSNPTNNKAIWFFVKLRVVFRRKKIGRKEIRKKKNRRVFLNKELSSENRKNPNG